MAVSLALNWSPPPSSPLFDDAASNEDRQAVESGQRSSSPQPSPSTSTRDGSTAASSVNLQAPGASFGPVSLNSTPRAANSDMLSAGVPARAASTSPQPKTYAAAAEASQRSASTPPAPPAQPGFPVPPLGAFPGAPNGPLPVMPTFGQGPLMPGINGANQQFAWAQYQQMLASGQLRVPTGNAFPPAPRSDRPPGSSISSSDDSQRRRTTSGPQRPAPFAYNDTFKQHPYPGVSFAHAASAGAFAGVPPNVGIGPAPGGTPGPAGSPGFHPYRRTPRGSDVASSSSASIQFGQGPTAALPGGVHGVGSPAMPAPAYQRTRSASTTSSGRDAGPAMAARNAPPPISYSAVAAGSIRPSEHASHAPHAAHPSSRVPPPRLPGASSEPSIASGASRPDAGVRSASYRSDNGVGGGSSHSPTASTSSHHVRTESFSSARSSAASTVGRTASSTANGSGASGGAGMRPSPLSRPSGKTAEDDDDDTGAVYGGSDDEGKKPKVAPTVGAAHDKRKGGLNKLRKALSFSNLSDVQAAEAASAAPTGRILPRRPLPAGVAPHQTSADTNGSSGSARSTSPPHTPDNGAPLPSSAASITSRKSGRPPLSNSADASSTGGKRSLFMNRKFNSSTDNISISSTVSSASVMLRRVGQLGKLASRRSLSGLTNMFNKDREPGGRGGLQGDDFGTVQHLETTLPTSSDEPAATAGKAGKKSKGKKGAPAAASVSHATVELEASPAAQAEGGMTPAASYVRQHQLQMRQRAEAEAARARQEAESKAAAAAAAAAASSSTAASASSAGGSVGGKTRTKTTDDVMENRQKMIEREKEKLKSKRGLKKLFQGSSSSSTGGGSGGGGSGGAVGIGGGGNGAAPEQGTPTGLETIPYYDASQNDVAEPAAHAGAFEGYVPPASVLPPGAAPPMQGQPPATSHPPLVQPQAQHAANFDDRAFDAAFDDEPLEPPQMPGARGGGEDSGDEFETDSLRHWGEGIEQARASAAQVKSVKGILKNSSAYNERRGGGGAGGGTGARGAGASGASGNSSDGIEKPFARRMRANSYDAPQASVMAGAAGGGIPLMSHLGTEPAATDRVDGVALRPTSPEQATGKAGTERPSTSTDESGATSSSRAGGGSASAPAQASLGHHANSSMPTLSLMMNPPKGASAQRSVTSPPGAKKRIAFADEQRYHSTWPAHVYDRRGELATCNRLTPLLAQRIKEELNTYKMEEMAVAPSSRIFTHFFV